MLLNALLQDGHLALAPLEEAVVKRVCEVELGLLVLVQALVGLPTVHVLRRLLRLSFVLGGMVAEG